MAVAYDWPLDATFKVFPVLLPVNIGVLVAFLYFYAMDLKEDSADVRYSSFLDEPARDLHRKLYVNEGKYLFYLNWGANVFSKVKV